MSVENNKPNSFAEATVMGLQEGIAFNNAVKAKKENVCFRIRSLRLEKKIPQSRFAEIINVNRLTYIGYENGRTEPNIEVLCRLAMFYKVSLDYICCLTDNRKGCFAEASEDSVESAKKERIEDIEKKILEMQKTIDELKSE